MISSYAKAVAIWRHVCSSRFMRYRTLIVVLVGLYPLPGLAGDTQRLEDLLQPLQHCINTLLPQYEGARESESLSLERHCPSLLQALQHRSWQAPLKEQQDGQASLYELIELHALLRSAIDNGTSHHNLDHSNLADLLADIYSGAAQPQPVYGIVSSTGSKRSSSVRTSTKATGSNGWKA